MSILALNKVNYSYKNGKKVLNDISMEFEKGKFYAILGYFRGFWFRKNNIIIITGWIR